MKRGWQNIDHFRIVHIEDSSPPFSEPHRSSSSTADLFECGEAAAAQSSSPGASETSETRTPSSERPARLKQQVPNFMEYVKKELFPEGVDAPWQIGAAPAARRQRQSNNSSSNSTDKVRKVCGEPEKNSRYCGREKRSYEDIYRQVTRTRPKGRDKAAEQKEWEANDAQWLAFQQIFGPDGRDRGGQGSP